MGKVVPLLILVVLAGAGFKFWPQIQSMIGGDDAQTNGDGKNGDATGGGGGETDGGDTKKKTGTVTPPDGPDPVPPEAGGKTKTSRKEDPKVSGNKIEVQFTLEARPNADASMVALRGTTNLPVGTQLLVRANYMDSFDDAVVEVREGRPLNVFEALKGFSLDRPMYAVVLRAFPTAHDNVAPGQNDDVKQLIGPQGDLLAGPFVIPRGDEKGVEGRAEIETKRFAKSRNWLKMTVKPVE